MIHKNIIVGCGISGLYLGSLLSNSTTDILMFEKNNYLGGRAYTIYGKNYQYEAGCARFNENHKNLIKLLKKFKLEKIKIPSSWTNISHIKNKSDYDDVNELITDLIKLAEGTTKNFRMNNTLYTLCQKLMGIENAKYLGANHPYYSEIFVTNGEDAVKSVKLDLREDKQFYIVKEGVSGIMNCLGKDIKSKIGNKIKTNHELKSITKNNNIFELIFQNGKTYFCHRLILAMDSCSLKKIKYLKKYNPLLNSVLCLPLLRIYQKYPLNSKGEVWFKDIGKIVTTHKIRYIIPVDMKNGIIMISYTDAKYSNYWKKQIDNKTVEIKIKEELEKLFPDMKIPKPKWTKDYYWKYGACYWKPGFDSKKVSKKVSNLENNLYICGSNYSMRQAWMEGALESSNYIFNLL